MKQVLIAALFLAWSCSAAWWVASGTNPVEQVVVIGRHLSTWPNWKPFRSSSELQYAGYEHGRLEYKRVSGKPDRPKNAAHRRLGRRA